jgi:nicotinamide riboside transporter PnuC
MLVFFYRQELYVKWPFGICFAFLHVIINFPWGTNGSNLCTDDK